VKQLRHYDDTGLLRPVHVERATGYRYYAREQARDALTVALLRDIDIPGAAHGGRTFRGGAGGGAHWRRRI